jgi:hypothetical protein
VFGRWYSDWLPDDSLREGIDLSGDACVLVVGCSVRTADGCDLSLVLSVRTGAGESRRTSVRVLRLLFSVCDDATNGATISTERATMLTVDIVFMASVLKVEWSFL